MKNRKTAAASREVLLFVVALVVCTVTVDRVNASVATLPNPFTGSFAEFGRSMWSDGSRMVVGAPGADGDMPQQGRAEFYVRTGSGETAGDWKWIDTAEQPVEDRVSSNQFFGESVGGEGQVIGVGATRATEAGAVYLYNTTQANNTVNEFVVNGTGGYWERREYGWPVRQRLSSGVVGGYFGAALAMDSDHVFVGAPEETSRQGRVYVYRTLTYNETLTGMAATTEFETKLSVVANCSNTTVHHSEYNATLGMWVNNSTSINTTCVNVTVETQVPLPRQVVLSQPVLVLSSTANNPNNARFGGALALKGDQLVVGARTEGQGVAYIYHRHNGGTDAWGLVHKLESGVANGQCGSSVATNGWLVAMGCPYHRVDNNNNNVGAAVSVLRVGADSYGTAEVAVATAGANAQCGHSVGVSMHTNDTLLLGCPAYSSSRGRMVMLGRYFPSGEVMVPGSWGQTDALYYGGYEYMGSRMVQVDDRGVFLMAATGYDSPSSGSGRVLMMSGSCAPGEEGGFLGSTCAQCPPGEYSRERDVVSCFRCPFGTSNVQSGLTVCNVSFAAVSSVSPVSGPADGATVVTIDGANFGASQTFYVTQGGQTESFVCTGGTATRKVCTMPRYDTNGVRVVELVADLGVFAGYTRRTYSYYNTTLDRPYPTSVQVNGRLAVTMRGSAFLTTGNGHRCRFTKVLRDGDPTTAPVYTASANTDVMALSSTAFACVSPDVTQGVNHTRTGPYLLDVSFNGQQYQRVPGTFVFYDQSLATAGGRQLVPANGLNVGNTSITVLSPGLWPTDVEPRMRFRDAQKRVRYAKSCVWQPAGTGSGPGTSATQHAIVCESPDFTQSPAVGPAGASPLVGLISVQAVTVSLNRRDWSGEYDGSWNPVADVNGVPFSSVSFTLLAQVEVSTLTPAGAPTTSVPIVAVFGGPFFPTNEIKLNATLHGAWELVDGLYINSGQLVATLPVFNRTSGLMDVRVALNGQQFSEPAVFNFFEPCRAGSFLPDGDVSQQCSPCEAGTFKAAAGDGICINCPSDTYCGPGSATVQPCPENTLSATNSRRLEDCGCKSGFYEPNGDAGKACTVCPKGAECQGQLVAPVAKPGFWNSGQDFAFARCTVSVACLGGTQGCAEGYQGRLCSTCKQGYYKLNNICVECPANSSLNLIFSVILFLGFLLVVRKLGVRRSAGTLAMGLALLQMTALMGDFQLRWPEEVLAWFSLLTIFNLNIDIAAPECNVNGVTYSTKYVLFMLMPFIVAGVMLVLFLLECLRSWWASRYGQRFRVDHPEFCRIPSAVKPHELRARVLRQLDEWRYAVSTLFTEPQEYREVARSTVNAYLLMSSLMYIMLTNKTVEMFACSELGDELVLIASPDIGCWTPEHMELVYWAIASLVLWVVGTPLVFLVLLYKHRFQLANEENLNTFGVLYDRYRAEWYWYEVVNLLRKAGFIAIKVFFVGSGVVQGISGQVVLLASCLLQVHAGPYRYRYHNVMSLSMLILNFFVMVLGVAFLAEGLESTTVEIMSNLVIALLLSMFGVVLLFVVQEKRSIRSRSRFRREKTREERLVALESAGKIPERDRVVRMDNLEIEEVAWSFLTPEHIKKLNKAVIHFGEYKSEILEAVFALHDFVEFQKDMKTTHMRVDNVRMMVYSPVRYQVLAFLFSSEPGPNDQLWVERLLLATRRAHEASQGMWLAMCTREQVEYEQDLDSLDEELKDFSMRPEREGTRARIQPQSLRTERIDQMDEGKVEKMMHVGVVEEDVESEGSGGMVRSLSRVGQEKKGWAAEVRRGGGGGGGGGRRSKPEEAEVSEAAPAPAVTAEEVTVLFAYDGAEEDTVQVEEGDVVELVAWEAKDDDEGWTRVRRKDGVEGFVPSNYVR